MRSSDLTCPLEDAASAVSSEPRGGRNREGEYRRAPEMCQSAPCNKRATRTGVPGDGRVPCARNAPPCRAGGWCYPLAPPERNSLANPSPKGPRRGCGRGSVHADRASGPGRCALDANDDVTANTNEGGAQGMDRRQVWRAVLGELEIGLSDRKSTRLNSSH